jgi:hypothetical protein
LADRLPAEFLNSLMEANGKAFFCPGWTGFGFPGLQFFSAKTANWFQYGYPDIWF